MSGRRWAEAFAWRILSLDCTQGLVVGVLGPWGSGKTTFVNYARPALRAGSWAVIDFNPWMFSGAEALVDSFFIELSAELRLKKPLAQIGRDLASYGESFAGLGWLPVIGAWDRAGADRVEGGRQFGTATETRSRAGQAQGSDRGRPRRHRPPFH